MNIDFGAILTKAWKITWGKKILWIFGFLAMLGAGGGGSGGNGGSSYQSNSQEFNRWADNPSTMPPQMRAIFEWTRTVDWNAVLAIILIAICCLAILAIILQFVSVIGRGGLIAGIHKADGDEAMSIGELWRAGTKNFLPMFVFRLIKFGLGIVVGLLSCVVTIPLLICTLGIGLIPWCLFMIVFGILFEYWFYLMDIAVVVEGQDISGALGRSWEILKANAGPLLIFWLILVVVSFLVGVAYLLLLAPGIVMIVAGLWPIFTQTGDINLLLLIPGIILSVIMMVVGWLIGAVYTTYEVSVHTLAYKEFAKKMPTTAPAVTASVGLPSAQI